MNHAPKHAKLKTSSHRLFVRLSAFLAAFGLVLGGTLIAAPVANAADTVSYNSGDTTFDLSPAGDSPNQGGHLSLGEGILLTPGTWTIEASATLFVPDVGRVTKNSQGCGLWSYDGQFGGAGGSSSGWADVTGGKEKQLNLITHPWSSDSDYDPEIVFTVPSEDEFDESVEEVWVELVCFIDQSHSGATFEDRVGMAAYDVSIVATATPPHEGGQAVSAEAKANGGPPPHANAKSNR